MSLEGKVFIKRVRLSILILITLSIIAFGVAIGSSKAMVSFGLTSALVIIFSAITLLRLSPNKDIKILGEVTIQGLWVVTSLGLVYLTLPLAPIFGLPLVNMAILMVLGLIISLMGALELYRTSKLTGVKLSI